MFLTDETAIHFLFVADDKFPLCFSKNILKPYSQRNQDDKKRIFSYRSSYFHRVSEDGFGILACRFCLFLNRTYYPETVAHTVLAAADYTICLELSRENHILLPTLLTSLTRQT